MESLGLGPNELLKENSKLIYARLSGYGQYGPMAKRAGHDINYVALTGLLSLLHRKNEKPFPPVNLLADFGGGGLMCALGITLALLERTKSGKGQIVDANMVEGTSYLGSWVSRSQIYPFWGQETGRNMLDSGSHFYEVYETKDGKFMAVGAIEPKFYSELLKGLGLTEDQYPQYGDVDEMKDIFSKRFAQKTQAEWRQIFDDSDACVSPVLSLNEAAQHPHNVERKSFVPCSDQGNLVPSPAPKLSRTPGESHAMRSQLNAGQDTQRILEEIGYTKEKINELEETGVIEIYRKSKM